MQIDLQIKCSYYLSLEGQASKQTQHTQIKALQLQKNDSVALVNWVCVYVWDLVYGL